MNKSNPIQSNPTNHDLGSTTLKLKEYTAPSTPIQTGIPAEDRPSHPSSTYSITPTLSRQVRQEDTEAVGYIDDVSILAVGPDRTAQLQGLLEGLHPEGGGGKEARIPVRTSQVRACPFHPGPPGPTAARPPPATRHNPGIPVLPLSWRPDGYQALVGPPPREGRGSAATKRLSASLSPRIFHVGHGAGQPPARVPSYGRA